MGVWLNRAGISSCNPSRRGLHFRTAVAHLCESRTLGSWRTRQEASTQTSSSFQWLISALQHSLDATVCSPKNSRLRRHPVLDDPAPWVRCVIFGAPARPAAPRRAPIYQCDGSRKQDVHHLWTKYESHGGGSHMLLCKAPKASSIAPDGTNLGWLSEGLVLQFISLRRIARLCASDEMSGKTWTAVAKTARFT